MTLNRENLDQVERAIRDHIAEKGLLPSTPEIVDEVSLGRGPVDNILQELVNQERISIAHEGSGNPTIYVPATMYHGMLRGEKQPDWIGSYAFDESRRIEDAIKEQQESLNRYHRLERLLYASGRGLERAMDEALSLLEFDDYEALFDRSDRWDFQFSFDAKVYIADTKGTKNWADKTDAGQVLQWVEEFVDTARDINPGSVTGLLIVNHFRHDDPVERWPDMPDNRPISEDAERRLQISNLAFITTVDVFKVIRSHLTEDISQADARSELVAQVKTEVDT